MTWLGFSCLVADGVFRFFLFFARIFLVFLIFYSVIPSFLRIINYSFDLTKIFQNDSKLTISFYESKNLDIYHKITILKTWAVVIFIGCVLLFIFLLIMAILLFCFKYHKHLKQYKIPFC